MNLTHELITELIDAIRASVPFTYGGVEYNVVDRAIRIELVKRMTDECAIGSDKGAILERLADAILHEEIYDTNPYKVAHEEYPFFSDRQLELRRDRETGLKAAEETGADGKNWRRPKRRKRSGYEDWRMDRDAKSRNAERAEQYRKDTAAGPISVSYVT